LKPVVRSLFVAVGLLTLSVGCQDNSSQSDAQGQIQENLLLIEKPFRCSDIETRLEDEDEPSQADLLTKLNGECTARAGYFAKGSKLFVLGQASCLRFNRERDSLKMSLDPLAQKAKLTPKEQKKLSDLSDKTSKLSTLGKVVGCFEIHVPLKHIQPKEGPLGQGINSGSIALTSP
jgi:hypothetical protein